MKQPDNRTYGNFSIGGMYLPWEADLTFKDAYDIIKEHSATLVDVCRSYGLWDLAGQMARVDGEVIEVGTWRGGTGCLLARRLPFKHVFLCDTFSGVVKTGPQDLHYNGGEHADATLDDVLRLAGVLGVKNIHICEGVFPEETGWLINTVQFCMAHIDVDVYQSAKDAFEWIWERLVPGGVVVFDDYGMISCSGITTLVDELKLGGVVVKNPVGQAIVVKMVGPSW